MKVLTRAGLISGMMGFMLSGCTHTYDLKSGGFTVHPSEGPDVSVRVYDESILRVTAASEWGEDEHASLVVQDYGHSDAPVYTVSETDDAVILATPKIQAAVSKQSGAVTFKDIEGHILLQEPAAGGKTLVPTSVMGEETFHIRQVFESPAYEAFYGLGQHQHGLMNYKGHRVDLKQHNLVAAVPFLVSSRNYGILWDNTSRTVFGDFRKYQPLSESLKLYNAKGRLGGLTADYFSDNSFKTRFVSRIERSINHETLQDQNGYPEGFDPSASTSIRWTGKIQSTQTGTHTIRLYSSGYVKLWLAGKLVADSWRQNWNPGERIVRIPMEAGKQYSIKLEWIPGGGYIGLKYLGPLPAKEQGCLSLCSEVGDAIDYYFIHGENADEVVSGYRLLTGRVPMVPKWAMGLWQSRERYKTQQELLDVVREFRKKKIPLDNIVQDWNYWPEAAWGDHEFDAARFPDPAGMIDELHNELAAHIMISVWPKYYVGTEHYNQFAENGWLYMRNVEKQERDWIGEGYVSTFYDPYSAGARDLFWKQLEEKLFVKGIDAWWLDATEPDIHANLRDDEYMKRIGPTAMGSSARYRNSYSLMNAKGVYEGQRASAPDQRVFILTRSAFAGQQRYGAATWSGDVAATWYDLKTQIPAGLNFCLSGIPYWTMDIGGFSVEPRFKRDVAPEDLEEWRELQTRWFQFGTFCPLFRVHGQYPFREMYNVAPENHPAFQTMLAYDRLRYRLMPYIYSLAGMVTHEDYTIMRALMMDFGQDPFVLNVSDQFMFGPAMMVCPVSVYMARKRSVYLPAGTLWYDLKTSRQCTDRFIQADAPYSDIPVFVRAGSIIPFGPAIQHTAEKAADPIRLQVYTGQSGSFTLYEDEGMNYNYEAGAFSRIPFTYNEESETLTIGVRSGSFEGMLEKRTFEVVWIYPGRDQVPGLEDAPDATVVYDGTEITLKSEKNDE